MSKVINYIKYLFGFDEPYKLQIKEEKLPDGRNLITFSPAEEEKDRDISTTALIKTYEISSLLKEYKEMISLCNQNFDVSKEEDRVLIKRLSDLTDKFGTLSKQQYDALAPHISEYIKNEKNIPIKKQTL